jgi:hypothetical protein
MEEEAKQTGGSPMSQPGSSKEGGKWKMGMDNSLKSSRSDHR